ncbi:MAG: alanine--tRNA ligase, partial [Thiotrichaceae bacterium]|nr:alanine--tRNA ligase [Thiotrichaceae bacterium]
IEIWNLVFMQYNRDAQGTLTPLPKPSVDTGMGLERLAAVMQGVHTNYDIDLFQGLIKAVATLAACEDLSNNSLRVIADHIRACAFLVIDGIVPSNEGRGYVLRRIIRRAIRHGHKLGLREPFFYRLVDALDEQMGEAYPELSQNKALVKRLLKQEEERFDLTLDRGMRLLEQAIADLPNKMISGELIFELFATYGFPTDLTADIARERGLTLELDDFERRLTLHKTISKSDQFKANVETPTSNFKSKFTGYDQDNDEGVVIALFSEGNSVEQLAVGEEGRIILQKTPFYAESGGQVGDKGVLIHGDSVFEVYKTQKIRKAHIHAGKVTAGTIMMGDSLEAKIDRQGRQATARHHTATHLLHAALREILGEHVKQKGSLVDPNRLRFDFSHFEAVTSEQLEKIEYLVNQQILFNTSVKTQLMTLDEAMNSGAMALFGEKYEEEVRVLSIGDFSTELCGGTHVRQIGEIGLFKIVAESGIAAGVRRIEAITGHIAREWVTEAEKTLSQISLLLKTNRSSLIDRLAQVLEQHRNNEKEIDHLQAKLASREGDDLSSQAVDIKGIKVLAANLDNIDMKQLRTTLDQLKNKLGTAAVVLSTVKNNKISLVAGVTKNMTDKIKAGDLVSHVAKQVGGKGGGRADMGQGGGNEPSKLTEALQSVTLWVESQLN